jgi:hypothetical protein
MLEFDLSVSPVPLVHVFKPYYSAEYGVTLVLWLAETIVVGGQRYAIKAKES